MRWLQSTWANRFNRYRKETGKLFQGRFKSLIVDEENHLGSLLDYVHLNPVRTKIQDIETLERYRWSSYWYLRNRKKRPEFLKCENALYYAGKWPDNTIGYQYYKEHLKWLSNNDQAQKNACFDKMSRGWAIGEDNFRSRVLERFGLDKATPGTERITQDQCGDIKAVNMDIWNKVLSKCLKTLNKDNSSINTDLKSAEWKVQIAAVMKKKTSATNVWLSRQLNMGASQGLSRYVSEYRQRGGEKDQTYKQLILNITE